jgi:hypothetical protein
MNEKELHDKLKLIVDSFERGWNGGSKHQLEELLKEIDALDLKEASRFGSASGSIVHSTIAKMVEDKIERLKELEQHG